MSSQKDLVNELERLSPMEVDVMRELWSLEPVTVPVLLEALNDSRGDSPVQRGTLHVLLGRLEEKGWVLREKEGRGYLYRASVSEETGRTRLTTDFHDRVFGGSPLELVQTLVRGTRLKQSEIVALRNLLDEAEKNLNLTNKKGAKK